MITQWDIISNINPQSGCLSYSLLLDGTEQDARLMAKKLQGYIQSPQPALAPYVYCFPLQEDLDEDTIEKIRTAVREGIEQAKRVNEFMPGGGFGNDLFSEDITKEDKVFPTFMTLDPSASFFRSPSVEEVSSEQIPLPELDNTQHKAIQLETSTVRTPVEADLPQPPTPHTQTMPTEEVFASAHSKEPAIPPEKQMPNEAQTDTLNITDKDMLNKDMQGSLLDESLEDIFSAETKYDMFLDLNQLGPVAENQPAQAQKNEISLQQQTLSADETDVSPAETDDSFNIFDQKIKEQTCFMDLDDVKQVTERITQKDLGFVEHADLAQAQTDTAPADPVKNQAEKAPSETKKTPPVVPFSFRRFDSQKEKKEEILDPFEQLLASAGTKEEPIAEKESGNQTQEEPISPEEATPVTSSQIPLPPVQTIEEPTVPQEKKSLPSEQEPLPQPDIVSGQTERENRVVPPVAAPITEKNNMSEHTEDSKKTIFRIKRKEVTPPAQPAAPLPPVPAAPTAPANLPAAPVPAPAPAAAPSTPEPAPVAPIAQIVPPTKNEPQEEKHHTILRRRRPSAHTILEKTRTIDHSIELPLSELKKHNWPLEVPLIPTYTLENMTISVNRFAHATAISVIENPGKLYNPLVLHGASGTGKTHFLHAIGYALSNKFGQENIFITNGVRLSRGIQRYVMEGNIEKFEEFASNAKAILIDDIHLVAVNEQNRAHLSKLLNDFRAQHKQIVVTSKYPPESLAKLEELLDFKLDSGWISELKDAAGKTRTKIVQKMLLANNINITDEDAERFFGKANMSLGTVNRAIRRVRVLERLVFPNLSPDERSSKNIFDKLLATTGEDKTSLIASKEIRDIGNVPVVGNGEWGKIGFFYPQNNSNMMNWLLFALQQRAKELGIPGGPELAVRSSYSTDNIISSAFKIANLCDNKKLKGAVILGPELGICESSVRENFYDILTHMLEIMLIRCGVINYENVNAPSTYVKILSELLR